MAQLTKRRKAAVEGVDLITPKSVHEAIELVKKCATAKFDETIDIAINLGVDPKHADQVIRGTVSLPHGTGKKMKVLVIAKGDKADEALAAGADFVAGASASAVISLSGAQIVAEHVRALDTLEGDGSDSEPSATHFEIGFEP